MDEKNEDKDMEQLEQVDEYQDHDAQINQDESKIESSDVENKEQKNTNTIPIRANAGNSVERLEMKFGGDKYDTQFTSIGKKKNIYACHAQTSHGFDIHIYDSQEGYQGAWIDIVSRHV